MPVLLVMLTNTNVNTSQSHVSSYKLLFRRPTNIPVPQKQDSDNGHTTKQHFMSGYNFTYLAHTLDFMSIMQGRRGEFLLLVKLISSHFFHYCPDFHITCQSIVWPLHIMLFIYSFVCLSLINHTDLIWFFIFKTECLFIGQILVSQ